MKIAHLILAHSEPQQLRRLINRLKHDNAYFFIHIDKKTAIEPFLFLAEARQVYFVKNRVNIQWGAYSMVQATLNGFKEIIYSGLKVDYVNLLSGADYPLKSTEEIHRFFEINRGKIFMEYYSVDKEWKEAIPRITSYHLTNYSFLGKYQLQKWLNYLTPVRKMPDNLVAVGRSQWFSIPMEAVFYIIDYLENHPEVVRFFKLTWAPDELIFQTILYKSILRSNMVNCNLRYIVWVDGKASPETLGGDNTEALLASDALFARKFNMLQHPEIMDALDQRDQV
jgi:hypothetical protein